MDCSDFTGRRKLFDVWKCRSLRRRKSMNSCQWNPISYVNKRFILSVLQCKFCCTGLKRLLHQNKSNFRYVWTEPDKCQPNDERLTASGQSSNWSAQSIIWHMWNASFSRNYSNITSENHYNKSGHRQPVWEAHSLENLLKWGMLPKNRFMGWWT